MIPSRPNRSIIKKNAPKYTMVGFALHCLFALAISQVSNVSWAHEGRPVYVELKALPGGANNTINYQLQWKIPPVIAPKFEPIISISNKNCKLSKPKSDRRLLTGIKYYTCTADLEQLSINFNYPDSNPALSSLILYQDLSGNSQHIYSDPNQYTVVIPKDETITMVASRYVKGGIKHILSGIDHLLFVACLIVLAGTLPRMMLTITGFTIAHTITLILTTLQFIAVPFLFMEILIALSILVLASEIIRVEKDKRRLSLSYRYPVLMSTLLGLLHGFGFASVLTDLGLPSSAKITALLFFNLGIEVGQIIFIICCLILIRLITKIINNSATQQALKLTLIYFVGMLASYWVIERSLSLITT